MHACICSSLSSFDPAEHVPLLVLCLPAVSARVLETVMPRYIPTDAFLCTQTFTQNLAHIHECTHAPLYSNPPMHAYLLTCSHASMHPYAAPSEYVFDERLHNCLCVFACLFAARALREWVSRPLGIVSEIEARLDAVESLMRLQDTLQEARGRMKKLPDLGTCSDAEMMEHQCVDGVCVCMICTCVNFDTNGCLTVCGAACMSMP